MSKARKKTMSRRVLRESEMQGLFSAWVAKGDRVLLPVFGRDWEAINYELKVAKGKTLPFSAVKAHQEVDLLRGCGRLQEFFEGVKVKPLNHKISDSALGRKPFDGFISRKARGYLIIGFHGGYDWVALDVVNWMRYKKRRGKNGRGSICYEDALRWGFVVNRV